MVYSPQVDGTSATGDLPRCPVAVLSTASWCSNCGAPRVPPSRCRARGAPRVPGRVYSGALRPDARSGAFAVLSVQLAESTEEPWAVPGRHGRG